VAVQAVKDSGLRFGDTVAIFGAGPIGLLTIVAARAAGASRIVVADLSQPRLDLAKKAGATDIINSGEKDAVQTIRDLV
ncbi:zinc-binding dehydrogenase, partial [Anaerostipes hadrus]